MNRRRFIYTNGLVATWPIYSMARTVPDLRPRIKTSCNFYSFNGQITSGTISTEEAIDFCAKIGFDGVDITGYYFTGYPEIPPDDYIFSIKNRVLKHGMRISGTGVRNDFAQESHDAATEDVQLVKGWIEVAAKLGAPMIRVFAGKKLKEGQSREKALEQVKDCLKSCIDYGRSKGVIVTYQNHNDVLFTAEEVKALMDDLKDPWFGLNLDIGSLRRGDPYEEIAKLVPYARNWQVKEHVYRHGVKEQVDLEKLGRIIKQGNYQGYVPLETLKPSDPLAALPGFLSDLQRVLQ